jgi:MoxR-like ATPase
MIVLLRCLSGTSSRRTRSTQYGPADGARVECLGFAMPAWKLFDPSAGTPVSAPYGASVGGESAYVYSDAIVVAVNSALLTGRPLLVRGPPGSGKSALAQDVALRLGWQYYEFVFTSRTNPLELLYRSKATERVRDSQVPELRSESHYYEPGVLWRAFEAAGSGAVALLDDIDRASPDLDDPLLTTLRSSSFSIEELELVVRAPSHAKLLLVITSNEDRALATRFTRSCVLLDLPPPSIEQLMEIGRISGLTEDDALARQVADYMFQATAHESIPTNVSTFLDALKVAVALGVKPGGPDWDAVLFHVREAWGLSLTDHRADDRASLRAAGQQIAEDEEGSDPSTPRETVNSGEAGMRVFYSYSHKDERLRARLETQLSLLRRSGLIEDWHDRKIGAGEEWRDAILHELESADIVLLLVSPDFLASDFIYKHELQQAMVRHESGSAQVIPIIIRPVEWHETPLGRLQALPQDGKAVTTWSNRDLAWQQVGQGIREAAAKLVALRAGPGTR